MKLSTVLFAMMAMLTAGAAFLTLRRELQFGLLPEYTRGASSLGPGSVNLLFALALLAAVGIVSLIPSP
jgi:hypothetical protein